MEDLAQKLIQLRDLAKSLLAKPGQNSLVPALKLPSPKPLSMPATSGGGAPKKIPGMGPASTKDPKAMAAQLKNPRPAKPKIEIMKTDKNGQWSLEKSADDYSVSHHSSYNHDNGTMHQFSIHHGGKHVASGYVHQPAKGHTAEPAVVSPEKPKHSHHDNPHAMTALKDAASEHIGFSKDESGTMMPDGNC